MQQRKFLVRLVRPVFEVAVVEVEAESEEMAEAVALSQSAAIEDKHWIGAFDPGSYSCEAQYVVSADETEDDFIFSEIENERKYGVLKANLDSGEGRMLLQPWMEKVDDLMSADLCMDWGNDLESLRQEGAENYFDELRGLNPPKEARSAKVIPFQRTEKK